MHTIEERSEIILEEQPPSERRGASRWAAVIVVGVAIVTGVTFAAVADDKGREPPRVQVVSASGSTVPTSIVVPFVGGTSCGSSIIEGGAGQDG